MKKTLYTFLLASCFLGFIPTLFAAPTEARIIEKNMSFNDGQMLIMEDNSIWMVYPVSKRRRSIKEWWKKVSIDQPEENFLFDQSNWKIGTAIYVREHYWTEENSEEMQKYNQPKITMCTHLLENPYNQQLAFARPIRMTETVEMFLDHAKNQYKEGEEKGKKKGYKSGFDDGRSLGKQEGGDTGYQKGLDTGYDRGLTQGVQDGFDQGYREGYDGGYYDGYHISQNEQIYNY